MPRPPDPAETVIVVGAGLSGLATALGVALRGGRALVLEASDLVGGAAAYSGGMVWVGANHVAEREGIDDDLARAEAYVRDLTHDHPELLDEVAMHRWLTVAPEAMRYWEEQGAIRWEIIPDLADYHSEAAGALDVGRYLTNAVIDGAQLGPWRARLRVSPNFPVGMTYAEMNVKGRRSSSSRPIGRGGPHRRARWRARVRTDGCHSAATQARMQTRSRSAPASWPASWPGSSQSRASTSDSPPA